jgi:hypothetical protein
VVAESRLGKYHNTLGPGVKFVGGGREGCFQRTEALVSVNGCVRLVVYALGCFGADVIYDFYGNLDGHAFPLK